MFAAARLIPAALAADGEAVSVWAAAIEKTGAQGADVKAACEAIITGDYEVEFLTVPVFLKALRVAKKEREAAEFFPPAPAGATPAEIAAWRSAYASHVKAGESHEAGLEAARGAVPRLCPAPISDGPRPVIDWAQMRRRHAPA
ncbi:hypothetical protein H8R18_01215 [Nanchangia anserum]|uniref:Uncharacterized protein n=1 Tax=Nanchangia anserum TaxID=2692125 RepID=A0A8I0KRY0_9ACTO|nr:hypothetical protein [Nanchangia anserum]MBD3689857.1 hypothetical protein [Nanchangia anserum]QOX82024.1 hypothetical protein H8R18_01215 [Nanchangia anserum]